MDEIVNLELNLHEIADLSNSDIYHTNGESMKW